MSKTKKVIIILLVILAILSLVYVYLQKKQSDSQINNGPTGNGPMVLETKTEANYRVLANYLMNTVLTQPPVLNIAWNDTTLMYVTPQGIYNANKNTIVYKAAIQKATLSYFADVLFLKKDGTWGYFNHISQQASDIKLTGNDYTISVDGKEGFRTTQGTIEKADLSNGNVLRQTMNGTITSFVNVSPKDTYITYTETSGKAHLVHVNSELVTQEDVEIGKEDRVITGSPDGTKAVTTDNKKLNFIQNKKTIHEISFANAQKLTAKWNTDGTIVVIEQLFPDELDRIIQNIWVISSNSYTTTILTDTKPMPRRLSSVQNPVIDKGETVIPLIERDGGIWLLSLIKEQFPALGEKLQTIPFGAMNERDHSD